MQVLRTWTKSIVKRWRNWMRRRRRKDHSRRSLMRKPRSLRRCPTSRACLSRRSAFFLFLFLQPVAFDSLVFFFSGPQHGTLTLNILQIQTFQFACLHAFIKCAFLRMIDCRLFDALVLMWRRLTWHELTAPATSRCRKNISVERLCCQMTDDVDVFSVWNDCWWYRSVAEFTVVTSCCVLVSERWVYA